jgi:hypothetical protein
MGRNDVVPPDKQAAMRAKPLTDVADGEQPSVKFGRAGELTRRVRAHGVSSLSPEELKEWRQVEKVSAQLAANPAAKRALKALNDQLPALVKADRIIRRLPRHERARYLRWTPAQFLAFHDLAKRQVHPVARSRESRPGRRSRSARASRDGPDEPEPPPPRGGLPRTCGFCGASLEGRRPNVQFCSDSHRVRACQLRSAERHARELRAEAARALLSAGEISPFDALDLVCWPSAQLAQVGA